MSDYCTQASVSSDPRIRSLPDVVSWQPQEEVRRTSFAGSPRREGSLVIPSSDSREPAWDNKEWPVLHEDLAQFRATLGALQLTAGYRLDADATVRVIREQRAVISGGNRDDAHTLELAVPLYRPCGERCGALGILAGDNTPGDPVRRVLQILLSLAARSIAERWFRLSHRTGWILIAAPVSDPASSLLLVLDQRFALRGMDVHAARYLGSRTSSPRPFPRWEDLFLPITPLPPLRARADVRVRLSAARDHEPWTGLLSPPDFNASTTLTSDVLLHSRPRCHGLADSTLAEREPSSPSPSFTPGMRRKIEEFIEGHLETDLSVERLARAAGVSCSHFTRAFTNVYQLTPHRYVMWRRVLRAQELIKNSDVSLAEVALLTGFSDQSHLCRVFHLNLGESPSRFRRSCR